MTLEVPLTLQPMEALPVDELPSSAGWLFEPKYDGFRCVLFRDGDAIHLQSRRQRPLERYFPEVIEAARDLPVERFVFDGELIIANQPFDAIQLRLHPAALARAQDAFTGTSRTGGGVRSSRRWAGDSPCWTDRSRRATCCP